MLRAEVTKRKPNKRKPVTLLVGIVSRDGIVVASDSQSTDQYGQKSFARKVNVLELADGSSAVVAEAGGVDFSSQTVERMRQLSKTARLNDYRTVADLACKALGDMRQERVSRHKLHGKALEKHFEDNRFWLLIANYHARTPYLFRFDSALMSATHEKSRPFVCVGNSYATADYILNKIDIEKARTAEAVLAAVFTINEVIGVDSTCSLPVQLALVTNNEQHQSNARLYDQAWINRAAIELNGATQQLNEAIKQHLTGALVLTAIEMGQLTFAKLPTDKTTTQP